MPELARLGPQPRNAALEVTASSPWGNGSCAALDMV